MAPQPTVKSTEQSDGATKRKGRGPAKNFPVGSFAESLALAKSIRQYATGDQIRRITLFQKLNRSPDSDTSRNLITSAARYGLTAGSHSAEFVSLTEDGKILVDEDRSPVEVRKLAFQVAIARIEPFARLYEALKSKRVPDPDVLRDEVAQLGIAEIDRTRVADIFLKNARYLRLIREVSGTERVVPIEQVLEEMDSEPVNGKVIDSESKIVLTEVPKEAPSPRNGAAASAVSTSDPRSPSVHIDVQIHIDSSASPEQIDQIFASMARHLYSRTSD